MGRRLELPFSESTMTLVITPGGVFRPHVGPDDFFEISESKIFRTCPTWGAAKARQTAIRNPNQNLLLQSSFFTSLSPGGPGISTLNSRHRTKILMLPLSPLSLQPSKFYAERSNLSSWECTTGMPMPSTEGRRRPSAPRMNRTPRDPGDFAGKGQVAHEPRSHHGHRTRGAFSHEHNPGIWPSDCTNGVALLSIQKRSVVFPTLYQNLSEIRASGGHATGIE